MKWPEAKLSQFCRFRHGGTPSKAREDFWNGDIPWVSPKDMRPSVIRDTEDHITRKAVDEDGALLVPPGSILIVVRSGILVRTVPVALTVVAASFNQDLKSLQVDIGVATPEFVFWFLQSRQQQMLTQGVKRGATVHSIQTGFIESLAMPVPSLREQRRIVEILAQADALRGKRIAADAKADRILPAIFYKLFGDPVTNPKGWKSRPIGEAVRSISGGTPSKANPAFWSGNIPWVSPKDMTTLLLSDSEDHITQDAIEQSATSLVPKGSILLVVRSGVLAHSIPVAIAAVELTLNQDLKAFLPDGEHILPFYLLGWFCSSKRTLLSCVKHGATVHSIDTIKLQSLPIMIPDKKLQQQFTSQFELLLRLQAARKTSKNRLEKLFVTLLHRAFSGELTASWRESHLKELLAEMEQQTKVLAAATEET